MINATEQLGEFLKSSTEVRSEYALAAMDLVDALALQMKNNPVGLVSNLNGDVTAVMKTVIEFKQKVEK